MMRKSVNGSDSRLSSLGNSPSNGSSRNLLALFSIFKGGSPRERGYHRAFRGIRNLRHWKGWRLCSRVFLIAVHLALVYLVAKVTLFPTDNPQEEWWPSSWGVPWQAASDSWATVAARRKTMLKQLDALTFQPPTSAGVVKKPARLKYPILWAAPFFSRSGYGTEAISYIAGLIQYGLIAREDLWITQAGDGRHPDALDGLDPAIRQLLWEQEWHNITQRLSPEDRDRPLVVVCHVFPDCWRTSSDDQQSKWAAVRFMQRVRKEFTVRFWGIDHNKENGCPCPNDYIKDRVVYRVGRSMFETERLPAPLVAYAEDLDEVLVPSQFNVDSFSKSGIPANKLHTLPQGINTTLFDPSKHLPMDLATLDGKQVTGPARPYVAKSDSSPASSRKLSQTDSSKKDTQIQQPADIQPAGQTAQKQRRLMADTGSSAAGKLQQQSGSGDVAKPQRQLKASTRYGSALAAAIGWVEKEIEDVATGVGVGGQHVPKPLPHNKDPLQPFRFLSVFKWETRKGWDVLLRAYFGEFTIHDNVELHVVTHAFGQQVDDFRDFMRKAVRQLLNTTDDEMLDAKLPRVYVYDKYIPDSKYPALYQAMDALVVPTHGEGWGRPQFEAMAMGLPVISTNWSGLTAFMDDTVAYPINVEAIVEVNDPSPEAFFWFKEQRWAQPSRAHLQHLMREVMNNRKLAAVKGQAARKRIQEEYSILAVAKKAHTEIQRIQNQVHAIMFGNGA